jgi:DNA polymerase (family X)
LLVELGRRTALAGDNYFRAKAYQRAADSLSASVEPLDRVIAENRLRELPGIGEAIADIVTSLHRSGAHPLLDKLRWDVPEGVLDMLSIPGLKPDKIKIIRNELGITDLAALEAAAREDRLRPVKGLGAVLQRRVLEGLKLREHTLGARHLHRADELAVTATETLKRSLPGVIRIVTAGDIRRGGELVSDLALVAEVKRPAGPPKVIRSGEMSVYLTDARRFGISLLLATGSRRHLEGCSSAPRQGGWFLPRRGSAKVARSSRPAAKPRSTRGSTCNTSNRRHVRHRHARMAARIRSVGLAGRIVGECRDRLMGEVHQNLMWLCARLLQFVRTRH